MNVDLKTLPLLLGAAHGLFLTVIIATRNKDARPTSFLFAFIVLLSSWQLFTFYLLLSEEIAHLPHAMWTSVPVTYLICPLFFLYTRFVFAGKNRLFWYDAIHLMPLAWELYSQRWFYLLDAESKMELYFRGRAEPPGMDPGVIYALLQMSAVSIAYFTLSYLTLRKHGRALAEQTSNIRNTDHFRFLARLFVTMLIVQFAYVVSLSAKGSLSIQLNYSFILFKSLTIHAIGYLAINRPSQIFFANAVEASTKQSPIRAIEPNQASAEKYAKSGLSEAQIDEFYDRLLDCIQKEKPHLNDDLNLSELAKQVGISNHHLSRVINQRAGQTFYDFINQHRVEYAKKLFQDPEYDSEHTIIEIAFKAGFNSKASFNRVFKKHTGQTPSNFRSEARKRRDIQITR